MGKAGWGAGRLLGGKGRERRWGGEGGGILRRDGGKEIFVIFEFLLY